MLDPKLLRSDLEGVRANLARRGFELDTESYTRLEERRKALQVEADELRNRRNQDSKAIGQAKAAGDQKRVEELEAEAEARQRLQHMQAFSTAPVDDILVYIEDSLAGIQEEAGVTMLVSKWDTETLAKYPSAELVDVTMMLVDAFQPTEKQREYAIGIQSQEPIPLEEAEKIEDW
jgi:seryl-tRNA synthetase